MTLVLIGTFFYRPSDRNLRDLDVISQRLRQIEQLDRLPTTVLQKLAFYGYYEELEEGITGKPRMQLQYVPFI